MNQVNFSEHDLFCMTEAFKQAKTAFNKDEVPVGAVVSFNNRIIAKAHNQVESLNDPTAHAEMIAITQACNTISQKWLIDCTLYTTLEPCSMCAGASVLSRLKRLIYATEDIKSGACGTLFNIAHNKQLNHRIKIEFGLMKDESSLILSEFFKQKRKSPLDNINEN